MKKIIIILALATALLLSGCTPNGAGGETSANWRTFVGGTQGVTIEFDIDAPPNEVNNGDEILVLVVLENEGEYDVPPSEYSVRIRGFSPREFGVSGAAAFSVDGVETLQANDIDPDTGETIESYKTYVQVPESETLVYNGPIAGNMNFNIAADVCYTYETIANAKLCIKRDLTKSSDTNICSISGPQPITNSGGPIQITDFKEFSGGADGVRFSFKVLESNSGGRTTRHTTECSLNRQDEGYVFVTVDTGINGLTCNGFIGDQTINNGGTLSEGFVKLSAGSRQITCRQTLSELDHGTDYAKIVSINARYDYEQSVNKDILIKKVI